MIGAICRYGLKVSDFYDIFDGVIQSNQSEWIAW